MRNDIAISLFDANCMTGPWPTEALAYEDFNGLLDEMDRLGIERALVSHTLAWQHSPALGNSRLMEAIVGQERLLPCWGVLPTDIENMGQLDALCTQMARNSVRAVRIYPRDHVYPLVEWMCGPLLTALAERRYLLFLDLDQVVLPTGLFDVDSAGWQQIAWICQTFPGLSVVLTRVGYRALRVLPSLLRRYSNLHIDLSYFATHQGIEFVVQDVGAERILFGTAQPLVDPGAPLARLYYADLKPADRDQIAHANLERLLAQVQV